jgi:hypothetical protein
MSSPLQPCKNTESGSTIILVLTGILLISLIAAGLLTSQKSLISSSQKIEQVEVSQDVTDLCVKNVIKKLKGEKILPADPSQIFTVEPDDPFTTFGDWILKPVKGISDVLEGRFRSYTQAHMKVCTYKYVRSRPIKGNIIGGELTRERAYLSQQATENIYVINVEVCADGSCSGVKTITNIYIGVQ